MMMIDGSLHIEEISQLSAEEDELVQSFEVLNTSDAQDEIQPTTSTSEQDSLTSSWNRLMAAWLKLCRGSMDDIGWLQNEPDVKPVIDGTEKFGVLLANIINGVHTLPASFVYLLIPGLFSNHGPLYFTQTQKHFCALGLECHIAKIHSEASIETNARELRDIICQLAASSQKRVMLCGHSKGAMDAAAALALYWDVLGDLVPGLVVMQSPYAGSPVASDLLREGQLGDSLSRSVLRLVMDKIVQGDFTALEDLTYERRRAFLRRHALPEAVACVCFHSEASRAWAQALPTLSHVAHTEVPAWMDAPRLPIVVPLSTGLAASALWLHMRYGQPSDGMVARKDAEVPGSVAVRPSRHLDHGWMVYSPLKQDPAQVTSGQMCEALVALLLLSFPRAAALASCPLLYPSAAAAEPTPSAAIQ